MLSKEIVQKKVFETCSWVGIRAEDIDYKVNRDSEMCRHGQWDIGYLVFDRWDKESPIVHARANGGLLRHSDAFCDSCVSAALSEFLAEAHWRDEYLDEWVPYQKARAMLASEGFEKYNMVFPKGSFVRVCDCGEAKVWSPAEVAFGRASDLSLTCPHCSEKAHVGIVGCYVMTSESGLYVEDNSGLSRMTTKKLRKCCTLDLSYLLYEGVVGDIRNVGMAMFLQEGGMGFAESWAYLSGHPRFEGHFPGCFNFDVTSSCRDAEQGEHGGSCNTCPRVWVKGGWLSSGEIAVLEEQVPSLKGKLDGTDILDPDLLTTGWTFEEAVCNLAMAVKYHYGDGDEPPVAPSDESAG